jgi:hypothetical protein
MTPHLLRCQGLAVDDYGFALGRLGSGVSSTFAPLGFNYLLFLAGMHYPEAQRGVFQSLQDQQLPERLEALQRLSSLRFCLEIGENGIILILYEVKVRFPSLFNRYTGYWK